MGGRVVGVLCGRRRALLDCELLADEVGRGRALRDERVRAVLEDRDDRRDDRARERRGLLVVLLDELAHVDSVRAERGANRRRPGRFAPLDLDLYPSLDLFLLLTAPAPPLPPHIP